MSIFVEEGAPIAQQVHVKGQRNIMTFLSHSMGRLGWTDK
jgi:hypothetical protein